jgi:hypothetical protein
MMVLVQPWQSWMPQSELLQPRNQLSEHLRHNILIILDL